MESFMVNHYLKQLFGENSERDLSPLLEDIICVFLTVRGFATARVLRNNLSGRTNKQSDSLRQALKSKNNNLIPFTVLADCVVEMCHTSFK